MIDTARASSGYAVGALGRYFAETIASHIGDSNVIFGSAYKGIPLCVSTAMRLEDIYKHPVLLPP